MRSDTLADSRVLTASSSLQAVPMDGTEHSVSTQSTLQSSSPVMHNLEPDATISRTQASLLSLFQTPYGQLGTPSGNVTAAQIERDSGQVESND